MDVTSVIDVNSILPSTLKVASIKYWYSIVSIKIHQRETLILLGLAILYLLLCVLWTRYQKSIAQAKLKHLAGCEPAVGYPHRERILGLDLLWICTKGLRDHTLLETTREIMQAAHNTAEYLVLGNKAIFTIEPENIKTILSSKFQEFGLGNVRKQSLKPLFGDSILNVDGAMWNHSRAFLRPHIARQKDGALEIFEKHVQNLIHVLPKDFRTIDIQDLFSCLMMDITTEIFLDESTDVLRSLSSNSQGRIFSQAFEYATEAVCGFDQINLYKILGKFFSDAKLDKSFKIVDEFLDRVIKNAVANLERMGSPRSGNCTTVLEDLLKCDQNHQRVKHEALTLLLAGKDTSTALLSHTWFMLARRPDIYAKLRAEVASLNGSCPSTQQLKDQQYLRFVLNESLRLFPPVPLNQRTAEVDTFLPLGGGKDCKSPLFVAKGTSVGYSAYAMHRRKDIFGEDADQFRPERWGENLKPGWAYIPFHGGPRACLGQQYALKKVSYVTVRLLQHFEQIESRDSRSWQERLSLTCSSRNGVKIGLIPVKDEY